ncbi:MAG: PA14 domain-containing protein [Deltaproteobacteria bacterium]
MHVPTGYSSLSEARRQHYRLLSEWEALAPGRVPVNLFQDLLRRRPPWFSRAAVAVLLVFLTLRYAWAVTYGKNWARQHPEGNWISRFYKNGTFEGYPLLRYDVGVNVDFGADAPADAMKKDFFSARWDTCLVVTQDVVVPLQLDSDDSSKVFVDDQLQFEVAPGPGHNSASVALRPGLRHVRVEFNERGGMAMVRLSGFEPEGTDAYSFRRPVIEGEELRCR